MPLLALCVALSTAASASWASEDTTTHFDASTGSSLRFTLEVPLLITGRAPTSTLGTLLGGFTGVRGGLLVEDTGGAMWGFDLAALVGIDGATGTPEVRGDARLAMLELRGLAGWQWRTRFSAFGLYGALGPLGGGGVKTLRAFDEERVRGTATWGGRATVGALLCIHAFTIRTELGIGVRDLSFETAATIAAGVRF